MSAFNFFKQFSYCVSGKKAVKSYPEGVYRCADHGGICQMKLCEAIHKNGIDSKPVSGKLRPIK